jgi:hypothetical protein
MNCYFINKKNLNINNVKNENGKNKIRNDKNKELKELYIKFY